MLDAGDRHNAAAMRLFESPPPRIVTSVLVVSETYSWCLHRLGEEGARGFRQFLADLTGLQVAGVDVPHLRAAEAKLDRMRGRKLSLVDASSLVFLEQGRITTVWGTDLDLALEGAHVVPGPHRP